MKHYLVFTRGVPALFVTELVNSAPQPEDYDWGQIYYARLSNGNVYWTDNWTMLFKFIGTMSELSRGTTVQEAGVKDISDPRGYLVESKPKSLV